MASPQMANLLNFAFHSLDNDDLSELFRPSVPNIEPHNLNISSDSFDEFITSSINSSSDELNYNFDFNHDKNITSSSKYISENQFKNLVNNFSVDTFALLHFNIRSLNKHFDELQLLLDNNIPTFPIVGLTETWLSSDSQSFSLNGYDLIVNNRLNRIGGGVSLYVPHCLEYTVCDDLNVMNNYIESLFIEISIPQNKNIIIGIIYRPPNSNVIEFINYITNLMNNPLLVNKSSFIMGDFNINLLKHAHNHCSQEFLETFLSASFLPLISKPTRVVNRSATLIDNIFCNVLPLPDSSIILSDITDHYPIMTNIDLTSVSKKTYPLPKRRRATQKNLSNLSASLNSANWSSVYNSNEINESFDNFLNVFNEHLDVHIPKQKDNRVNYKISPRLPWISKSLLRSINRKNRLYYNYKSKKSEGSKAKYTLYKNILTTTLRIAKKKYYTMQLEFYKHDIKNTWKILKQAMNVSKKKSNIEKIKCGNQVVNNPLDIANTLNSHFSMIGDNLARNVPNTNKHFSEFLDQPIPNSIFFAPTTKYEIMDVVTALKNKQSAGHDDISNFILKGVISSISDPLAHVFNVSILNGVFPERMKIAKVIPLFKKGDKLDPNNYRPISLLPTLSKILEKLIFKRMIDFLNTHNVFTNSQFGFRQKHSTVHALLNFVNKVAHSIDNHSHLIGIFLDFSKAFDTINHDILLYKLSHYGIRGKALEWFRNYLTNRKQYTFLNGHNSTLKEIKCGVPQGSLLGPLLFILYINDFCRSSNILSFILFADDSNVFFSHDNSNTLINIVNSELDKLTAWIRANKLSLNLQKTKYMFFSNTVEDLPSDVIFDNTSLERVSNIKFLGITVDDKLSWKSHIVNISNTISRNIGVINKLKYFIPSSSLLTLYSSLILPYLNYGILAWGNTQKALLDKLLLLQKKSLRIIFNKPSHFHTNQLFLENKILKVKDLYSFQLGQFMYNYNNNSLPSAFDNMFPRNQSFHNYPTRRSNEFHLPLLRTLLAQNTFIYTGPHYWNSLKDDIRGARSLNTFKSKLKKDILQSYIDPNTDRS